MDNLTKLKKKMTSLGTVQGLVKLEARDNTTPTLQALEKFVGDGQCYATAANVMYIGCVNDGKTPIQEKYASLFVPTYLSPDVKFEHMPRFFHKPKPNENIREVLGIFGESGSGKSTYADMYLAKFLTMNPNSVVYIYSRVANGYDRAKKVDAKRVIHMKLDASVATTKGEQFKNCAVVFDDINRITPALKDEIMRIRSEILETGRHENTYALCIEHLMFNYKESRDLLNECTSITVFPGNGDYHIRRYLQIRLGLKPKDLQIDKILDCGSRWATIFANNPKKILTENETWLVHPRPRIEYARQSLMSIYTPSYVGCNDQNIEEDKKATLENIARKKRKHFEMSHSIPGTSGTSGTSDIRPPIQKRGKIDSILYEVQQPDEPLTSYGYTHLYDYQ